MFPCYRYLCSSPQLGAFPQKPEWPYLLAFNTLEAGKLSLVQSFPFLGHPGPYSQGTAPISGLPGQPVFSPFSHLLGLPEKTRLCQVNHNSW